MTALRIAVIGTGRLGREIIDLASAHHAVVHATFTRTTPVTAAALTDADVVIDVSVAEAVRTNVHAALAARVPIAIGTTGWHELAGALRADVESANGAMLVAPNFSLGVALFTRLVAEAAHRLTPALGFDAQVVETHHAAKRDAPSGTAIRLREAAGRPELPITSIRTGHVPGTHEAIFDARYEQVRLVHEARDRRVFADGALQAARWLVGRRGWFTMDDVVTDLIGSAR
jgi:4-hydroxy-tetrahydrodipicolinate reductase